MLISVMAVDGLRIETVPTGERGREGGRRGEWVRGMGVEWKGMRWEREEGGIGEGEKSTI
jgi:hypothetical protein